ncbi:MAG: nucleoside monophosphate kinase [Candidatus Riflemargulisbacteria bacterium]
MKNKLVSLDTSRSFQLKKELAFSTRFSVKFIEDLNKVLSGKTIVFLGGPAAGKGTKIAALELLGLKFQSLSTGDALRSAVKAKTIDGLNADAYMHRGENVPDEIVNRIVVDFLKANGEVAVFLDGYPREVEQARFLMEKRGEIFVIDIRVSLDTALMQAEMRRNEYLLAGKIPRTDGEVVTVRKRYGDYKVFRADLTNLFNEQQLGNNIQICDADHRDLSRSVDDIIKLLATWFM